MASGSLCLSIDQTITGVSCFCTDCEYHQGHILACGLKNISINNTGRCKNMKTKRRYGLSKYPNSPDKDSLLDPMGDEG